MLELKIQISMYGNNLLIIIYCFIIFLTLSIAVTIPNTLINNIVIINRKKGVAQIDKDHFSCNCALGIAIDHTVVHARFGYKRLHLAGDVLKPVVNGCADLLGSLHFSIPVV
jgi:hypothetical protein